MSASATELKLSRELRDIAKLLSKKLDAIAGEHVLFSLHVWGDGRAGGVASYVSNAKREDIIKATREWLAYAESNAPDIPAHERQ
jgi:hypothetical protein